MKTVTGQTFGRVASLMVDRTGKHEESFPPARPDPGTRGGSVRPAGVPGGYTWRPLEMSDVPAVFLLEAAAEAFDDGVVEVEFDDLEADWRRPDFDPQTMSLGVFSGGRLWAYAQLFQGRAEAVVHPDRRGRGLGEAVARWTWDATRAQGRDRVGQTVSENEHAAEALFQALGYEITHTSWILRKELDPDCDPLRVPVLPDGYSFREYDPGSDDREVFDVIDIAFDEWRGPGSESMGFDNWSASMLRSAGGRLVLLIEREGRMVGTAVCRDYGPDSEAWIDQIAVAKAHRGRGLGGALLEECFRRFATIGRHCCGVSTDSRSGALGLYENAGMAVDRTYRRWTKSGL